jgi:hypothetical protein
MPPPALHVMVLRRFISHPHQFEHDLEDCDGARARGSSLKLRVLLRGGVGVQGVTRDCAAHRR